MIIALTCILRLTHPSLSHICLNLLLLNDICRNKKKYAALDEHDATCMAMEGVEVVNGLENKIACNSYKVFCCYSYPATNYRYRACVSLINHLRRAMYVWQISYVLDTEDFFFRRRKTPQHKSSNNNQAKVQRFHRFLSASQ